MRRFAFVFLILLPSLPLYAQLNSSQEKTGWSFGVLPVLSYNTDNGFRYGIQGAVYDYGKAGRYPDYRMMLRAEVSRSTGGSGVNQLFFDAADLFRRARVRLTADVSYLTDRTCPFFGFNGREAHYDRAFTVPGDSSYISRVFYGYDRELLRVTCDLRGPLLKDRLYWLAGAGFFSYHAGTVNISRLNKGKPDDKKLPDTALLYDDYVAWGLIPEGDADGGSQQVVKAGLVYDSRDREANPTRGLWSEVILVAAPSFLGNRENAFGRLALTHRQYVSLIGGRLTIAYRLAYQGRLWGTVPFYSMPYLFGSYPSGTLEEGLGGGKSARGILQNRLTGEGVAYGNAELRWKFLSAVVWKQNIYLALSPFLDAGGVVQKVALDMSGIPPGTDLSGYFTGQPETIHLAAGCGLHIALNENFVVSADFGHAFVPEDGHWGIYVGLGWLF